MTHTTFVESKYAIDSSAPDNYTNVQTRDRTADTELRRKSHTEAVPDLNEIIGFEEK
jgi:hypothetical protein